MDILIVGLGVIGTTYGYLFQKAGFDVEHYIRKSSPKGDISELKVNMLDGRLNPKGVESMDRYIVRNTTLYLSQFRLGKSRMFWIL